MSLHHIQRNPLKPTAVRTESLELSRKGVDVGLEDANEFRLDEARQQVSVSLRVTSVSRSSAVYEMHTENIIHRDEPHSHICNLRWLIKNFQWLYFDSSIPPHLIKVMLQHWFTQIPNHW